MNDLEAALKVIRRQYDIGCQDIGILNLFQKAFRAYHSEQQPGRVYVDYGKPDGDMTAKVTIDKMPDGTLRVVDIDIETMQPEPAQDIKPEAGCKASGYGMGAKSGTVVAIRNDYVWVEFVLGKAPIEVLRANLKVTEAAAPEVGDFVEIVRCGEGTGRIFTAIDREWFDLQYGMGVGRFHRSEFTIICKAGK